MLNKRSIGLCFPGTLDVHVYVYVSLLCPCFNLSLCLSPGLGEYGECYVRIMLARCQHLDMQGFLWYLIAMLFVYSRVSVWVLCGVRYLFGNMFEVLGVSKSD